MRGVSGRERQANERELTMLATSSPSPSLFRIVSVPSTFANSSPPSIARLWQYSVILSSPPSTSRRKSRAAAVAR